MTTAMDNRDFTGMEDDQQALTAILRTLSKCDYQRDLVSIRNLLYKILTLSTNGSNIKPSLPVVVKFLAHPDAFVKRVAGEIMAIHAEEHQDITLLGINTLVQDCQDVNPVVRGISFRILGCLKTGAVSEALHTSIVRGLTDKNGYVRRSAALSSLSLNKLSPDVVLDGQIWDLLYRCLRDEDAATVAACLCALEEVCAKEKGIVMSNKLGLYLISNIHNFPPTVQRVVLQFLMKFSPKTKDQMFENLNELDDNLTKAQSFAMAFCAYELFSHLTRYVPKVKKQLSVSAWSAITTNWSRERCEEIISAAIHYLDSTNFDMQNGSENFNKLVCRSEDSAYLTHHKISVLTKIITLDNVDKIFSEYLSCVRTMSLDSIKHLTKKVSEIFTEKPDVGSACVEFLKDMIATERSEIVSEVIQILPSITLSDDGQWKDILNLLEEKSRCATSLEAKTALLQVIKTHASKMENPAHILDDMFLELHPCETKLMFEDKKMGIGQKDVAQFDHLFKVQLLGAMVQVFLLRPALIHPMLAKHMELCIKDKDHAVREKALMYYGFLYSKVKPDL